MKAKMLLVLVALVVLAAIPVGLGACGGGDDQALFEDVLAVWANRDAALAEDVYASDVRIVWPEGSSPQQTNGIDEVKAALPGYPIQPALIGDATFTYAPSGKDIEILGLAYEGERFISGPVHVGRVLYQVILDVRDGKVVGQWVTNMRRD